ncbi:MAG: DUF5916 domain-containing protein [Acidobacteriota bacterium]|nr:DUF5916 domain-containing protein [Acidobacteriota bacterium]
MLSCVPGRTVGALALLLAATASPARAGDAARVVAGTADGSAIRLDGRLDEPAWAGAGVIATLVQQDPQPGRPTVYATEVRLLTDETSLFVAFTCRDPDPAKIAVHTMQRDGDLYGDDSVAVVLETLGDQRRGYLFRVNAAGARLDGLISGPESVSTDWDGIWDARVRRTADGWTAEIRIPAQTLRFTPHAPSWGLNVERYVARDRLTLRWTAATLDARLIDLRRAGRLEGVDRLRQGRGVSISPYALARSDRDLAADTSHLSGDAGLDVTWNLTSEISAVLTVNTDFAETEVDTRQVNLTRFPLFFPEKRSFFLEGSNLFSFGSGLRTDFIPFFSRRIGLHEGQPVPIDAGVKLLGQSGRWGVALLDVQTASTPTLPAANLFAGRVTFDANDHLTLGTIVTRGDPDGARDRALYGVDLLWQTSTFHGDKNFSVGAWTALSQGGEALGKRSGWGLKVDYPNDLWDAYLLYKEFGRGLDPALGFLPRPGTRWYQGGGAYQPRPTGKRFGWVRQFFFELYGALVLDSRGRTESWKLFSAPFNARTESGEHIEANVMPLFERLDQPFEIAPGVVIAPGGYSFTRYRVEAQSSRHRAWQIGGRVWFGTFYGGRLREYESYFRWTSPRGAFQVEAEAENNFGSLPAGDFIQRLWQLKLVYAFNPDLLLSSYFQYDSESRNLGLNSRLRWTLRPGNELYVVNQRRAAVATPFAGRRNQHRHSVRCRLPAELGQ